MTNEEILKDDVQIEIIKVWDRQVNEAVSGRLFCTTHGKRKIAKIIGLDYDTMGKDRRRLFSSDIIGGYQMGVFKKNSDY
jgi:hypothetical protein